MANRYVSQFFERTRTGKVITGNVVGNHGTYTVSIEVSGDTISAACSCYVGGSCHHCEALAEAFLQEPKSFKVIRRKTRKEVKALEDVAPYLKGVTLDTLLQDLKEQGITQKQVAESIGMSPRHLSVVKSSELRHRYFHELGATKLACIWLLEQFGRRR